MAGLMNSVKSGADLTHPRLSLGWILGAIIAAFLLILVVGIAFWGWGKATAAGLPGASAVTAPVRTYLS